jgi:glycosyltransferase involved in cell wall biosynthesis
MRRRKQITGWVALGLAIAATVPAMAQSRPSPSQNQVRQPMELGLSEGKMRALGLLEQSGTTNPVVVSDADRSIDVNAYTVTGFGVALLFAMAVGMSIVAAWHGRGTRLTPA